jgi:hypothetical protein
MVKRLDGSTSKTGPGSIIITLLHKNYLIDMKLRLRSKVRVMFFSMKNNQGNTRSLKFH